MSQRSSRYFSHPYPPREALGWMARNLFGPTRRHRHLTAYVPSGTPANAISPRLSVAFIGDIMPLGGTERWRVDPELARFLSGADLLVGNLEGTIVEGRAPRVFLGQRHTPAVLDFLAELFPPARTMLSCANNHAGDFGSRYLERSCDLLQRNGFQVFGTTDRPWLVGGRGGEDGGVVIAGGTCWSNRRCPYVCRLEDVTRRAPPPPGRFTILSPHWGYELEAYPRPTQIAEAVRLAERWDMIVGHHAHCPQPVTLHGSEGHRQVVAYSLGNFTFGLNLPYHLHGLVLRVQLGPDAHGRWRVGRVWWHRTRIRFVHPRTARLEVA